jgi:hypothetical protein
MRAMPASDRRAVAAWLPRIARAAALGLGLVLVVVVVSAMLRLGAGYRALSESSVFALRLVHRVAATSEVLVAGGLAWLAWRHAALPRSIRVAVAMAAGLTVMLSLVGIAAGQNPPAAASAINLLGGLALAAVFACIASLAGGGRATPFLSTQMVLLLAVLLAAQLALGARLSIAGRYAGGLPLHALLALGLCAFFAWLALARVRGIAGRAMFCLALAAPLAGLTSLQYEFSAPAAIVHAAVAALFVSAGVYLLGRRS